MRPNLHFLLAAEAVVRATPMRPNPHFLLGAEVGARASSRSQSFLAEAVAVAQATTPTTPRALSLGALQFIWVFWPAPGERARDVYF